MNDRNGQVEYFPGTTEAVPACLTPAETVRLLRLDVVSRPDGTEEVRALGDALRSLDRLVGTKRLMPRRFGKSRTFSRQDVIDLIVAGPAEGA